MCKNTGQSGFDPTLKDRVRVIGCAIHLEQLFFYPNPYESNPNPIDPTGLVGLLIVSLYLLLLSISKV